MRRAFVLLGRGSLVDARPLLDQVRRLDPARVPAPLDSLELQAALALAEHGDAPAALRAFSDLDAGNPTLLTAENWNALCWQGSLNGYAREVLPACERALALDPGNGGIRDSRGLARALAGDTAGAIEDFEAFNRWAADSGYADLILVRERWIEDLRAGRDPFDDATLLALRE